MRLVFRPLVYSIALLLSISVVSSYAAPSFNSVLVFTDNRPFNDLFGIFGWNLSLQATVSDPLGVPSNIATVRATNLTTGETRDLFFAASEQMVFQGPYNTFIPFSPSHVGVWRFVVTNKQGQVAVLDSHNLDKPVQLPLPQNIRVENISTTGSNPPRVTFDAVPGANFYALEIYDESLVGRFLFDSSIPSFELPVNALTAGHQFFLRIRALQFDLTDPVGPGVDPLENRSVNAVQVSIPDIPAVTATPPLTVFPSGERLFSDLPAFLQSHGQEFSPESQSFLVSLVTDLDSFLRSPTIKQSADAMAEVISAAATFVDISFALSPTNTLEEKLAGVLAPLLTPYVPRSTQVLVKSLGAFEVLSTQIQLRNPVGFWVYANALIWGDFVAPQLDTFARDPFDPDYQSVVVPSIPPVTPLPSTGNAQLDSNLDRLQEASIQTFVFLQAVQVSFDRYNSALAVGDPLSAGLQLEAILHYLAMYDNADIIAAELWNQLPAFLQDVTYNPDTLRNLQAEVATTGFPPVIINFLGDIGLTGGEIDELRVTLLSLDPNQFSGTLFRGLSDLTASLFYASTLRTFIDIKPGEFPNSINPNSRGNIPVAILSTKSFDAVSHVDRASLTFGRTGDEHSLNFCNPNGEDVNGDRLLDLVCHFDTQKTAFKAGDTLGILKGENLSSTPFISTDSVQIVPPR